MAPKQRRLRRFHTCGSIRRVTCTGWRWPFTAGRLRCETPALTPFLGGRPPLAFPRRGLRMTLSKVSCFTSRVVKDRSLVWVAVLDGGVDALRALRVDKPGW